MLEKLLGVSPPQKGLAQDSKVVDNKNLQPDFKKDFERQLQKKLDQKSNLLKEDPKNSKAQSAKKNEDELRAERNEKKPSGGTKKKMVEADSEVKMISNVMALPESEFEVPDQKLDLAMIETEGTSEESKIAISTDSKSEKATQAQSLLASTGAVTKQQQVDGKISESATDLGADLETDSLAVPIDEELGQLLQALETQAKTSEKSVLSQSTALADVPSDQIDTALASEAKLVVPEKAEQASFEDQLSQEVGFQSDLKQHVAQAGLVQKMKEFESEKGMSAEIAQNFEQKVLEQLRQEKTYTVSSSEMNQNSFSDSQTEKGNDPLKELKVDSLKNESGLHVGQSQDFKNHMATPLEKTGTAVTLSQLLEKREENVQEVVKQAQYLATKGGGEMTVKMSPDGMGEIQLKVLMEGGRLNIEMQTQDKSVKKLIEDSLTELKSGLAAQQLSVDHVRISTVNATNTENSAQFQSNLNHSEQNFAQAQDQQKEFWKQFQNNFGNQARRGSYSDVAAVGSRASAEPNALQPIKTSAARASGRTGSTLNRVA